MRRLQKRKQVLASWVGICLGLFIWGWFSRPVFILAQSNEPALEAESKATFTYGQAVTFLLEATAEEMITAVRLTYSAPQFPVAFTVDLPLTPNHEQVVSHPVPYPEFPLDPFTTITYSWEVETAGGASFIIPPQTIDYVDDRFDWHSLVAPGLVVYHTDSVPAADAMAALEAAAVAQATLEPVLPETIADPLRVVIYPTTADMRSTLRLARRDLENGLPPADLPVVMVTAVNPRTATLDLQRHVPEEILRLRYVRVAGVNGEKMPAWLPAGLPVLFETSLDSSYHSEVDLANWPDICAPPPAPDPAGAQSLVNYLYRTYGPDVLGHFITALAAGVPCTEAVLQQFDLTTGELTRLWHVAARPASPWQRAFQQNGLWLGLLAGSLVFMTLILLPLSGWFKRHD